MNALVDATTTPAGAARELDRLEHGGGAVAIALEPLGAGGRLPRGGGGEVEHDHRLGVIDGAAHRVHVADVEGAPPRARRPAGG